MPQAECILSIHPRLSALVPAIERGVYLYQRYSQPCHLHWLSSPALPTSCLAWSRRGGGIPRRSRWSPLSPVTDGHELLADIQGLLSLQRPGTVPTQWESVPLAGSNPESVHDSESWADHHNYSRPTVTPSSRRALRVARAWPPWFSRPE